MVGDGTSVSAAAARQLREHLAAVLAAVDRGELDATSTERAYLAGGVGALDALLGHDTGTDPI